MALRRLVAACPPLKAYKGPHRMANLTKHYEKLQNIAAFWYHFQSRIDNDIFLWKLTKFQSMKKGTSLENWSQIESPCLAQAMQECQSPSCDSWPWEFQHKQLGRHAVQWFHSGNGDIVPWQFLTYLRKYIEREIHLQSIRFPLFRCIYTCIHRMKIIIHIIHVL